MSAPAGVAIRRADRRSAEQLGRLAAQALMHDPVHVWLVPDPDERAEILPRYYAAFMEYAFTAGEVNTNYAYTGVVAWLHRDGSGAPHRPRLNVDVGRYGDRFTAYERQLATARSADDRCHQLVCLAVHPDVQGQGIGTALLRGHHDDADVLGLVLRLDATSEGRRQLYLRHGYRDATISPTQMPDDGPVIWSMVRAPSTQVGAGHPDGGAVSGVVSPAVPRHVVVALSGGLCSTVVADMFATIGSGLTLLAINDGQDDSSAALGCARLTAERLGAPLHVADLGAVGSPLSLSRLPAAAPNDPNPNRRSAAVLKHARLVAVALDLAVVEHADAVAFGAHTATGITAEMVADYSQRVALASQGLLPARFAVRAPFIEWPLADIVSLGARLDVPWTTTWSCELDLGLDQHCGICPPCTRRRRAFVLARVIDPTPYAADLRVCR